MGLLGANVSDAKRAVSWGMFINIIITPMIIGMVEWPKTTGIFLAILSNKILKT